MPNRLQIIAASPDPALLTLPWHLPLEEWPEDVLAALPRGISRHVVRFVKLSGRVIAVKEIGESVAHREYDLLRQLDRIDVPSVEPVGVVTGRVSREGEPLTPALVTEHLQFSLPYRALFSQYLRPDTATRLIDALAVLLVRLHLNGFYWGDVSLSNTLFRRDAGAFAAYLVDAETGDLHEALTPGQRAYDLEIARVNVIGELMDLEAGEILDSTVDTLTVGEMLVVRYEEPVEGTDGLGVVRAGRTVAGAGAHRPAERPRLRRRRTGHVHRHRRHPDPDPAQGGRRGSPPPPADATDRSGRPGEPGAAPAERLGFLPDVDRSPGRGRGVRGPRLAHERLRTHDPRHPAGDARKLEPAEAFHEVLEHRWYLSQQQDRDVPLSEAVPSYLDTVLRHRPDEVAVLGLDTATLRALDEDDGDRLIG